jgi:antitoxin VapB
MAQLMDTLTTKVFQSGGSQAVRLPKEFRFIGEEVFISRDGEKVILSAKPPSWDSYFSQATLAPDDFMAGVEDLPPQTRSF